jgi:hypothetical protein
MDLTYTGGVDRIQRTQEGVQWRALVIAVHERSGSIKDGVFLD